MVLRDEIVAIDGQLDALVRAVNPTLLSLSGVDPVTAGTLLAASGDSPERLTSKASFAALAGVAPIPASSGQRVCHRLSRGGNRQAINAPHRIVLLRLRHLEPRTMAHFDRRRGEGLTDRYAIRGLKRHVGSEICAALNNPATDNPVGHQLRAERQCTDIPITVLAATLGVPYQRLRRLEIGARADPELEQRATTALAPCHREIRFLKPTMGISTQSRQWHGLPHHLATVTVRTALARAWRATQKHYGLQSQSHGSHRPKMSDGATAAHTPRPPARISTSRRTSLTITARSGYGAVSSAAQRASRRRYSFSTSLAT